MQKKPELTVFFDMDCGFCQASKEWLERRDTLGRIHFVPYQTPGLGKLYPQIDLNHFDRGMQTLALDGTVSKNEMAVAACLRLTPGWRWLANLITFPLLRPFCIVAYWFVARNRRRISRFIGKTECPLPPRPPSSASNVNSSPSHS